MFFGWLVGPEELFVFFGWFEGPQESFVFFWWLVGPQESFELFGWLRGFPVSRVFGSFGDPRRNKIGWMCS